MPVMFRLFAQGAPDGISLTLTIPLVHDAAGIHVTVAQRSRVLFTGIIALKLTGINMRYVLELDQGRLTAGWGEHY
jgi:hypothetical protein